MTRQINLLKMPPRPWKWWGFLAGLSLTVLLHAAWAIWLQWGFQQGEFKRQVLREKIDSLDLSIAERRKEPKLAADIKRKEDLALVSSKLESLAAWRDWQLKGDLGRSEGFSSVLEKLASVPQQGLLLNQIEIKSLGLSLNGLALDTEQVLNYKDALNQKVLALGYTVSGVEVSAEPTQTGMLEFKLYGLR